MRGEERDEKEQGRGEEKENGAVEMAPEQRDIKKSALVIGDLHANDPQPDDQWPTSAIFTEPTARGKSNKET